VNVVDLSLQRVTEETFPPGRGVELPGRGGGYVYHAPAPRSAPTLVLLHGLWATGSLNWFPAFAPLRSRFGVAAVDLRGHGRGLPVDGHFRLADCADDVAAVVDALGVGPAILVGYSLGGVVAQMTWKRHRDRVAGLVLCATSRNFGGTRREQLFYQAMSGSLLAVRMLRRGAASTTVDGDGAPVLDAAAELDAAAQPAPAGDAVTAALHAYEASAVGRRLPAWAVDELRRCSPVAAMGALAALGRFSSHSWIGRVDVPAAVVVTARDHFISPVRQRKLAAAIPGATVHEVESDHAACVIGAERFVPALVTACESVAQRARRSAA
jgi:pimeloyl-ACP methyl ester carboxylesterase